MPCALFLVGTRDPVMSVYIIRPFPLFTLQTSVDVRLSLAAAYRYLLFSAAACVLSRHEGAAP